MLRFIHIIAPLWNWFIFHYRNTVFWFVYGLLEITSFSAMNCTAVSRLGRSCMPVQEGGSLEEGGQHLQGQQMAWYQGTFLPAVWQQACFSASAQHLAWSDVFIFACIIPLASYFLHSTNPVLNFFFLLHYNVSSKRAKGFACFVYCSNPGTVSGTQWVLK